MKNKPKSRREFLVNTFLKRDKLLPDLTPLISGDETDKRVKMLTPDGKLVEVSNEIVQARKRKVKARNSEILGWISEAKNK